MIHFLQFFYAGKPWYSGAVWGNAFVVPILAVGGWLWSRTRFWPLKPLERMHKHLAVRLEHVHARLDQHEDLHAGHTEKLDAVAEQLEQVHAKLDRVAADMPQRRKRTGS